MTTNPTLPSRIVAAIHAFPRRSLAAVLLFVVLAGVFGGAVGGAMQSEGGFAPADADSARALERIEAATGQQPSAGILLLVDPADVESVSAELADVPGIAAVAPGGESTDGSSALVTGTIEAGAPEEEVAHDVVAAFEDTDGVTVGGPAVAGLQLGEQVEQDLTRAELLALPILVLLSILIFGGRAAVLPLVVGVTTVLGTFLVLTGINEVYHLSV
ncbi:MAG: hypothetical protein ABWZ91_10250, partial [Nocardioides sp.]